MSKSKFVGASGEFYVAAYLSEAELLVALPRAGIPGSDLFVAKEKGGHPIRVQVKTGADASMTKSVKHGTYYSWLTKYSVSESHDANLWYAYVWLNDWRKDATKVPEVFFIPSDVVANRMKELQEENGNKPNSWSCFWMLAEKLDEYKGDKGLEKLRESMSSPSAPLT